MDLRAWRTNEPESIACNLAAKFIYIMQDSFDCLLHFALFAYH
jgi:hypothetical protein